MYSYLRSQQSRLYTAPTSSTEQVQSFDPIHHQNQHGSSLNFKNALTPSVLSPTYHGSNSTDPENTNSGSSTKDKISTIHGFESVRLPDISKVFEAENLKFAENQLIQISEHWNTYMTQKLSLCKFNSTLRLLEPRSLKKQDVNSQIMNTNHEKSEFYLLNPIFLLARLRTPQHAFQLLTEKKNSNLTDTNDQNEKFGLKPRGILTCEPNIFEQIEIISIFPNSGSCYDSSFSSYSPDSLFTDKSPETSISEYTPNPVFPKDVEKALMLQIDDSSEEERSKMIANPIENWTSDSDIEEISECEGITKLIPGPEYIYSTEVVKKSQDISENTRENNITHFNTITCFNELSFYQQLFLTPRTYHLMQYNPKTNCPLVKFVPNYNFDGSDLNIYNNKSLTKNLSLYELITHCTNRPDQLSNNLIYEKRIESNLLQSFNHDDPTLQTSKDENSYPGSLQKIINLTEDSLAAYQHALESTPCNANANVGHFLKNIISEEYLQLKHELSQPSSSNDSYEASSQEAISLSDEFEDDFEFDFDDDSQDCAFIEAVNSEALANDFDGFYGQEFGLYSTSDVTGRNLSYKNGSYSKVRCIHSRRNSRFWSREPLLSPITECSEFSFCSPYEAPLMYSSNSTREITSSEFPSERLKTENETINILDSSLESRKDLWSISQKSVQDFNNYSYWSSDSEE